MPVVLPDSGRSRPQHRTWGAAGVLAGWIGLATNFLLCLVNSTLSCILRSIDGLLWSGHLCLYYSMTPPGVYLPELTN